MEVIGSSRVATLSERRPMTKFERHINVECPNDEAGGGVAEVDESETPGHAVGSTET